MSTQAESDSFVLVSLSLYSRETVLRCGLQLNGSFRELMRLNLGIETHSCLIECCLLGIKFTSTALITGMSQSKKP